MVHVSLYSQDSILYLMTVSLVHQHAVIGIFNCCLLKISKNFACNIRKNTSTNFECLTLYFHYFESFFFSLLTCFCIFLLLRFHGDIELNSGPKKLKENTLSMCHWNLNSITAHKLSKLSQLEAYISAYKHDFICLSETYLDSSAPSNIIDKEGYKLVRSDHPDNIKRGRVCIYYKQSLPVRVINLPFRKEALLLEMCYKKKSDYVCNLSFPKQKY